MNCQAETGYAPTSLQHGFPACGEDGPAYVEPMTHVVKVCFCPSCYVRGAARILNVITGILGTGAGEISENGSYTLETVKRLGGCRSGPVIVVDDEYHFDVTIQKVREIFRRSEE